MFLDEDSTFNIEWNTCNAPLHPPFTNEEEENIWVLNLLTVRKWFATTPSSKPYIKLSFEEENKSIYLSCCS